MKLNWPLYAGDPPAAPQGHLEVPLWQPLLRLVMTDMCCEIPQYWVAVAGQLPPLKLWVPAGWFACLPVVLALDEAESICWRVFSGHRPQSCDRESHLPGCRDALPCGVHSDCFISYSFTHLKNLKELKTKSSLPHMSVIEITTFTAAFAFHLWCIFAHTEF